MIGADKILFEMLITEKATQLSSNQNQYSFRVSSGSSRAAISNAVESAFGVKVRRVNVMNVKPKKKPNRFKRGGTSFTAGMKKAIVTLKPGEKIEIL